MIIQYVANQIFIKTIMFSESENKYPFQNMTILFYRIKILSIYWLMVITLNHFILIPYL